MKCGLKEECKAPVERNPSGEFVTKSQSTSEGDALTIWTVGHSTHSAEAFDAILQAHAIEALVDVRSFPGSRRYPQFNQSQLSEQLKKNGIDYFHNPKLGGRRRPSPTSTNTAWRNASFRAYADHMDSAEFKAGIDELVAIAKSKRTAIMCAESVWWRCHRSLISDYLKANGLTVIHIMDAQKTQEHPYTSAASIVEGKLSYEGLLKDA